MLYEFEEVFVVDSSGFETTFGVHATPLEQGILHAIEWYRQGR
jgi:hypothetical protein